MYNLEQITASDTEKKGIKRLTLSFSHKDGEKIPQIIKQIKKVVEVIDVSLVEEGSILSEVGLIKIRHPEKMVALNKIIAVDNVKILNATDDDLIIQIVGSPEEIFDFKQEIESDFEIVEFGSSGAVAMSI